MGQEIGFHLYKKADFDKDKRLVEAEGAEAPLACDTTEATCFWGALFRLNGDKTTVPVFQKELDGFDDGRNKYELVDFEDFRSRVDEAVRSAYDACCVERRDTYREIEAMRDEIGELREWQRRCTEDNSYAFDRWERRIRELKESIASQEDYARNYGDEDRSYAHARQVEGLLSSMEKRLREDEYLVVPLYGY